MEHQEAVTTNSEYENYRSWKQWNTLFQPRPAETRLFDHEFKGIELHNRRLLDIGFGSGSLLGWAKAKGAEIEGLEIQPDLVEEARRQGVVVWDSLKEIDAARFDVISLFDVCEHIPRNELPSYFAEIARLAKQGATIVVRVPNCQSPHGLINQLGDPTHISMLSGPILASLGTNAGLSVRKIADAIDERVLEGKLLSRVRAIFQWGSKLVAQLTWAGRNIPVSANVIVVFDKAHLQPSSGHPA